MVPILSTLRLICFKGHSINELEEKLGILNSKDSDYNFIFSNVPEILEKSINDVMYCAQNISMLKASDEELYRIMIGKAKSSIMSEGLNFVGFGSEDQNDLDQHEDVEGILELVVNPNNLAEYQKKVNNRFLRIEGRIRDLFLERKIKSDRRRLELLKEKLTRLKKMKLQVEMQKEQKHRMRELEKFKRAQLNNIM
jgi:hypothetical protein